MTSTRLSLAAILCLSLLAACDSEATPPAAGDPPPAEVLGTWLDPSSTTAGYTLAVDAYDFGKGVWFRGLPTLADLAPARGLGLSIASDGSFLWVLGTESAAGGCQASSVQVLEGTVTTVDGVLHFHPARQRERFDSTCDPSLSYDRSVSNVDFDLRYELGTTPDSLTATLRLTDPSRGFDLLLHLRSR